MPTEIIKVGKLCYDPEAARSTDIQKVCPFSPLDPGYAWVNETYNEIKKSLTSGNLFIKI